MTIAAVAALAAAIPAAAATPSGAAGIEVFHSSDSDGTEVVKTAIDLHWRWDGPDKRHGIRLEKAWFKPLGARAREMDRAYVRVADSLGAWKWSASPGTDGHSVIGSASIHNDAKVRQEYFVERDVVETPVGLKRRIYYTFGGAAIDLPADERSTFTLFAGVQEFSGDNVRTHVRGSFVHVLKPAWGLSVQLRGRYFHSSDPREFDYYSPRWYAEVLPVVQVRRFVGGWQLLGAAGYGVQRDAETRWHASRFLNARVTSPGFHKGWAVSAAASYSNTPVSTGLVYRYTQLNLALTKSF